jgi:NitT/TauT family transport system substrate-binding protein
MCKTARHIVWFIMMAVGTLALGCSVSPAAEKITFVTDFGFNGRHAYYFVAKDKGYYAKHNLDVDIVRGKGSADAVKQVAAGNAQLGFADAAAVILGRGNDGLPVKLVAMIYAKSPHAIYVLADSGITKPKDLEGKTIADTAFSAMPKLFPAYAKAAHIDASKVKWVVATSTALPGLLSTGRVDGIGQYVVGEALLAEAAAPKKIRALTYAAAGLNIYSNGIIASENTIKDHPQIVREFVAATLEGLKYAVAHPEQAGEIMHKYHPEVSADIATDETKIVGTLINQPGEPLGYIEPKKMQATVEVVAGAFKLKHPVKAADVYEPGFVKR